MVLYMYQILEKNLFKSVKINNVETGLVSIYKTNQSYNRQRRYTFTVLNIIQLCEGL